MKMTIVEWHEMPGYFPPSDEDLLLAVHHFIHSDPNRLIVIKGWWNEVSHKWLDEDGKELQSGPLPEPRMWAKWPLPPK